MVLEPRQAAPGALRRWSVQALRLITRGLSVWLGLILLLCLAIFAGQRLPLISGVLALMAFFVLACQCMSTVAAIKRETGSWRWPVFVMGYTYSVAYVAAILVYQVSGALGVR